MINLMALNRPALIAYLGGSASAKRVSQWIHQQRRLDIDQIPGVSRELRAKLAAEAVVTAPSLVQEQCSDDGTRKWLLRLEDGNSIETVYIPPQEGADERGTLCLSSQVGCSLNCRFCATAKAGFNRNLTTAEIIGQLWWALTRTPTITNVVMMGMGEPLLNYAQLTPALDLMLDDWAYGLSKYRVTVSTAGLVPAMQRLRGDSPVSLAVSLHAPTNALRTELVPLNKKFPLETLMPVCRDYFPARSKQTVLFEYVMLRGVNDQPQHCQELSALLTGIRCKVNLIPFNPFPGTSFQCSDPATIADFQARLIAAGVPTWVRRTRGREIQGACGQLAGDFLDRTLRRPVQ